MDSGVIQYGIFINSFSAKDMNISTVQIGGKPKSGYANECLVALKAQSLIVGSDRNPLFSY